MRLRIAVTLAAVTAVAAVLAPSAPAQVAGPEMLVRDLGVRTAVSGLDQPVSMAFIGRDEEYADLPEMPRGRLGLGPPRRAPFEADEVEIRPVFEAEDFGDELTPELRARDQELRQQVEGGR